MSCAAATSPSLKSEPCPEKALRRALLPWLLSSGAALLVGLQVLAIGAPFVLTTEDTFACVVLVGIAVSVGFAGLRFARMWRLWRGDGRAWRAVRGHLRRVQFQCAALVCVLLVVAAERSSAFGARGWSVLTSELLVAGAFLGWATVSFALARWTSNTLDSAAVKRFLVDRHRASSRVA